MTQQLTPDNVKELFGRLEQIRLKASKLTFTFSNVGDKANSAAPLELPSGDVEISLLEGYFINIRVQLGGMGLFFPARAIGFVPTLPSMPVVQYEVIDDNAVHFVFTTPKGEVYTRTLSFS